MGTGLLIAGFLGAANAGRAALVAGRGVAGDRVRALMLALAAVLVVAGALVAEPLLDALDVSPESFRIAAGLVLAAAGLADLVRPRRSGPPAAALVTPDLACMAIAAGADRSAGAALAAGALALALAAVAAWAPPQAHAGRAEPFLAALEVVAGVALVVAGVRDV